MKPQAYQELKKVNVLNIVLQTYFEHPLDVKSPI